MELPGPLLIDPADQWEKAEKRDRRRPKKTAGGKGTTSEVVNDQNGPVAARLVRF